MWRSVIRGREQPRRPLRLGILAATALPKFADLQKDARLATIKGAQGSIAAASALAHSVWLVAGSSASSSVSMEGTSITMLNGYPDTSASGIVVAANLSANDYTIASAVNPVTVRASGATVPASCQVSYTAATAGSAPVITLTATQPNC